VRILFLNHNVGWQGGTFFRAYEFARHLAQRGHRVTLLTISKSRRAGSEHEERDGVEVIYTPDLLWGIGRTGWDPWDTFVRCALVGREPWDIVHAWDSRPVVILPALWAARRGRRAGTQLVLDWCDWWGRGGTQAERQERGLKLVAPLETWFEEAFRRKAHGSTVISRALFDRAVKLGVVPGTIRLLPQGCDVECAGGSREAARRRLGLSQDTKVLVSIGALIRSDAKLLFDSLALLFARCPDCRFFLIGRSRVEVPAAIRQSPQFTETGFVTTETLRDYMEACDGLLAPLADTLASRARWPSKVNPLLAMGRAVIITKVGDLPALLEQQDAALVARCDAGDVVEKALLLFSSTEVRDRCESRARAVARDVLAWPLLTAELDDFYSTLRN
jgi:glycosyltransferase involved in cell wall biosynthesis